MADPLRDHESSESRIEELLLAGLDHYFNGQHELAISVWTRVLFLDRSHARARAYIERARGAIAERQREGEELLQTGAAAFQRGDAEGARRLLTSGVLVMIAWSSGMFPWSPWPASTAAGMPGTPLPVPSASEVSLARARGWAGIGRLRDALVALDGIRPG